MEVHQSSSHHQALLCDGSTWNGIGGSWIGHMLPGAVMLAWGLHWLLSSLYTHFNNLSTRSSSRTVTMSIGNSSMLMTSSTTTSRHHYSTGSVAPLHHHHQAPHTATHEPAFIRLPWWLPLEAWLKVLLPIVALCLEFGLSGTRQLRCPAGSVKAGQLDITHMNSWSHATNYPPLVLSGIADLIHHYGSSSSSSSSSNNGAVGYDVGALGIIGTSTGHDHGLLPWPLPHVLLSCAFGVSSFLMLSHAKAEPLDAIVHQLLGLCMAASAAAVLAYGIWGQADGDDTTSYYGNRSNNQQGHRSGVKLVLGMAKAAALMMQGCWFLAITHIIFAGDATWAAVSPTSHAATGQPEARDTMTRVMFVPVLFCWIFIGLLLFMLLTLLAMQQLLAGSRFSRGSSGSRGRMSAKYIQLPEHNHFRSDSAHPSDGDSSSDSGDGGDGSGRHDGHSGEVV